MEGEKFTNKLFRQLEEVEKTKPSDDFLMRMEAIAVQGVVNKTKIVKLSSRFLLSIAASLLILIMLNSYAILSANGDTYASEDLVIENYDLLAIQNFYHE